LQPGDLPGGVGRVAVHDRPQPVTLRAQPGELVKLVELSRTLADVDVDVGLALAGVLALQPLFVGERNRDRRDLDLHAPELSSQDSQLSLLVTQRLIVVRLSKPLPTGIHPRALPRAGQRDIRAIGIGVLSGDHVRAVNGLALGGERVRHVGEPGRSGVQLAALPCRLPAIR